MTHMIISVTLINFVLSGETEPEFHMRFCQTRWVENVAAQQRAIRVIPHLPTYVKAVSVKADSFIVPSNKSYKTMKKCSDDKMKTAKLHFFVSMAKDLERVLKEYQCDKPMVPFLFESLESLLSDVMERFIKSNVLDEKVGVQRRLRLDLDDENNVMPVRSIHVGYDSTFVKIVCFLIFIHVRYGTISAIIHLKRDVEAEEVTIFYTECLKSLKMMSRKVTNRAGLKSSFLCGCACLDPEVMKSTDSATRQRFLDMAFNHLVTSNLLKVLLTEAVLVVVQIPSCL